MLTYQEARANLSNKLGNKAIFKLAGNTYLQRHPNKEDYTIEFHGTRIITIHSDGTYTLNSGGHRTATTKKRLNEYSTAHVFQEKGEWYVGIGYKGGPRVPFFDGMKVDSLGVPCDSVLRDMLADGQPAEVIQARVEELQAQAEGNSNG